MVEQLDRLAAAEHHAESSYQLIRAFPTTVARTSYPYATEFNPAIADVVMARLAAAENKFDYKSETSADMLSWGEPAIDAITRWVLQSARRYVEAVTGQDLQTAYGGPRPIDADTVNDGEEARLPAVSISADRSWASVYRRGDRHEAHFHPNTALTAIYYVEAPDKCDLDLLDPRPNVDYFDAGISFAGESQRVRLRCAPGDLVVFPGWLKHAVPEFTDEGVRISLSWNLGYRVSYSG